MNLPKPRNLNTERYIGGLSKIKEVDKPIKLSANESAIGASPKAIKAYNKDKNNVFKYPETDSNSLREAISKKLKINLSQILHYVPICYLLDYLWQEKQVELKYIKKNKVEKKIIKNFLANIS